MARGDEQEEIGGYDITVMQRGCRQGCRCNQQGDLEVKDRRDVVIQRHLKQKRLP